ncbi:SEC-C metal-binding domain-containing protein, partial [Acinetobacter baumannii]|uniref:SEC-C metal-binding domain-containing protein n=1 Tax=Acinetobacter baumannii TaxID=470 RepID=UPI0014880D4E
MFLFYFALYWENRMNREISVIGRNDLCSCGSQKKYKKCCLQKNSLNKSDSLDAFFDS